MNCKDMLLSLKLQVPSECQIQVPRFPRFGYYLYTQIISATERAVIARTVKMSACKERSKWLLDWNPTISGSKQVFFFLEHVSEHVFQASKFIRTKIQNAKNYIKFSDSGSNIVAPDIRHRSLS